MSSICRFPLTCSLLAFLAACTQPNSLLRDLAREDQAHQAGETVPRTNEERITLVLAELGKGAIRTPEDRFNAALVLQHTGLSFCENRLVGVSPDNYLLAHHLARSAFDAGYAEARYLVAQTIDRYLSMTKGSQKYGTNRFINQETGQEELSPIDRATSDAERAVYGVPPLAELLKQFPEQHPKKPPLP